VLKVEVESNYKLKRFDYVTSSFVIFYLMYNFITRKNST